MCTTALDALNTPNATASLQLLQRHANIFHDSRRAIDLIHLP